MKKYHLSDLEKTFNFTSIDTISFEFVSDAYYKWERKLENAYLKNWITTEAYAKSLSKIKGMADYLMHIVSEFRINKVKF